MRQFSYEQKTPPAGDTPEAKEGYKKAFSGFFTELVPALAAGNGHFAHIAGKLQPAFALGAAEVQVFLAVLEAVLCLLQSLANIAGNGKEFLVFGIALINVAGEQAIKSPYIHRQTEIAEEAEAGQYSQHIESEARPDLYTGELVSAVPACHKASECVLDLLPHNK